MPKLSLRQVVIGVAMVATVIFNLLATALPLNGRNTAAISDSFKVFFVPSGYVFAIWGVIYVGLVAIAIYNGLIAKDSDEKMQQITPWLLIGAVANCLWLVLWHTGHYTLTLVAMLTLLATLILTYLQLGIGKVKVDNRFRWMVHIPVSIYMGWITVATIANVTDVLWNHGVTSLVVSGEVWSAILILVAMVIGSVLIFTRKDIAYASVLIWAIIGIVVKFPDIDVIKYAGLAAVLVMAVFAAFRLAMQDSEAKPAKSSKAKK